MKLDRDRFDRQLEHKLDRASEQEPQRDRAPVITSKRGPRFYDFSFCPVCYFGRVGITYEGTLADGQRVFWIATHSPSSGARRTGKPICTGSGRRVERGPDGNWRLVS